MSPYGIQRKNVSARVKPYVYVNTVILILNQRIDHPRLSILLTNHGNQSRQQEANIKLVE